MVERAVLVEGPEWWASPLIDREGLGAVGRSTRAREAREEELATRAAVGALRPGTLLVAVWRRGAVERALAAAGLAGLPTMVLSAGVSPGMVLDALRGLAAGRPVGALVFTGDPERSARAGALSDLGLRVRVIGPDAPEEPAAEPVEEPTTEAVGG